MSDIFISYARTDYPRAKVMAQALEAIGWSVWWDPRIPAGRAFDRVIEEEISKAKCVIVLWSRQSVDSDWVRAEASAGLKREILVPVLAEKDVEPPLRFSHIQSLPLFHLGGEKFSSDFDELVLEIEALLGRPPKAVSEAMPTRIKDKTRQAAFPHEASRGPSTVSEATKATQGGWFVGGLIGSIIGILFGIVANIAFEGRWLLECTLIDGIAGAIVGMIAGGTRDGQRRAILMALVGCIVGGGIGLFLASMWFALAMGAVWGSAIGAVIGVVVGQTVKEENALHN